MFLINVDYISSFTLATIALEASLLLNINSPWKPDVQHTPQRPILFFLLLGTLGSLSVWVQWNKEKSGAQILTLPHVACMAPQESSFTTLSFGLSISKLKRSEGWSPRSLTFSDERTDWRDMWENPSGTERLCVLSSLGIFFIRWNLLFLVWSFSSQAWGSAAGGDAGCMQGRLTEESQAKEKDLQTAAWP